jgi:FkbM family methyltransferase
MRSRITPQINMLFTAIRIIRSQLYASRKYNYPKFQIILPSNHKLPTYQIKYKNYDKFLPHLAKYLKPNDLIVDIGANCGDTLAAMASENIHLQYVCIEPDNTFYTYLEKNISILKKFGALNIIPIKALIGKDISNVVLTGEGGTKNATSDIKKTSPELLLRSRSLDSIFESELQEKEKFLKLIKSDVDGFDYDVLNSAEDTIKKNNPILFFECQCDNENQKKNYFDAIEKLISMGYRNYWIFDNFGELLLHSVELENIKMLVEYVWRQRQFSSKRTIYYFDILCCTNDNINLVTTITNDYVASILTKN